LPSEEDRATATDNNYVQKIVKRNVRLPWTFTRYTVQLGLEFGVGLVGLGQGEA